MSRKIFCTSEHLAYADRCVALMNEIIDADSTKYGLANVAPTVAKLLGLEAPDCWEDPMI